MSNASRYSSAIADALERAKASTTGDVPAQVNEVLEQAHADTWRRIRANPDTYELTKQECAVMLSFSGRHSGNRVYEDALGRYWKKEHGSTKPLNGRGGSSSGSK